MYWKTCERVFFVCMPLKCFKWISLSLAYTVILLTAIWAIYLLIHQLSPIDASNAHCDSCACPNESVRVCVCVSSAVIGTMNLFQAGWKHFRMVFSIFHVFKFYRYHAKCKIYTFFHSSSGFFSLYPISVFLFMQVSVTNVCTSFVCSIQPLFFILLSVYHWYISMYALQCFPSNSIVRALKNLVVLCFVCFLHQKYFAERENEMKR